MWEEFLLYSIVLLLVSVQTYRVRPILSTKIPAKRNFGTRLQISRDRGELSSAEGNSKNSKWWLEDDENVIYVSDESKACMQGEDLNLFDQLPNRPSWFGSLGADRSTIAMQTLREVSESYLFSLSFLGDYVVQLGVRPPVDVDAKIGDFPNIRASLLT